MADILGTPGNDVLVGTPEDDTIDGGAGDDTMSGGAGNDTYVVDSTGDTVTENAGEGMDGVQTSISYTLGANVESLTLLGTGNINGTGNDLNNVITGNTSNNILDGGAGDDTMSGGAGHDFLNGGAGNDVMLGGVGDDGYVVDSAGDMVTENAGEGFDAVESFVSHTLSANVENLFLQGTDDVAGTGNDLNNVLVGNPGNNSLEGGLGSDSLIGADGDDTMSGGAGDDTYSVDSAGDTVTENAGEGTDEVRSNISYTLGTNVENLTLLGSSDDTGTGNDLNNLITGNIGNNILDGGAGDDTMSGGAGDDTYVVDSAGDTVTENAGEGTDQVRSTISYTLGANVENLTLVLSSSISGTGNSLDNVIIGNSGDNSLSGNEGSDHLYGDVGNDTLDGGLGNDYLDGGLGDDAMSGGAGDDTYVVDSAGDTVTENAGEGIDLVRSTISYTLGANVENLTILGDANGVDLSGTGNELDNVISAAGSSTGADLLLSGMAGNDTISATGDAVASGPDFTYVALAGDDGDDHLTATGSAQGGGINYAVVRLEGGTGNDVLEATGSSNGANSRVNLWGGTGNDQLTASGDSNGVDSGVQLYGEDGNDTLLATGDAFNGGLIRLDGGAGNDTLTATGEVHYPSTYVLDGGEGDDLIQVLGNANSGGLTYISGGTGNDVFEVVNNYATVLTENAGEGTDEVRAWVNWSLEANVENLTLLGTGNINGTGNDLNNIIIGNIGNNMLDGGAGDDTMLGGAGDDTYVVDSAGDTVTENAGEGTDEVRSTISYTLGANVENLTLLGTGNINGTGNSLNNIITGNGGNNSLNGGTGVDTVSYAQAQSGVTVSLAITISQDTIGDGVDRLTNFENLVGSQFDDLLTGSSAANILYGLAGNDRLSGGAGADILNGGIGNDTYVFDNIGDVANEIDGDGIDTIESSQTISLSNAARVSGDIENVTLTGAAAINATGNALENTIIGNTANNVLDGQAGADQMIGGLGNDTYYVDSLSDVVVENFGEGTDTIQSAVSLALVANVENLTLAGSLAINAVGNDLANTLTGNSSNNILDGGQGADRMIGGAGDDTYIVDSAGDITTEAALAGQDTVVSSINWALFSNVENLTLVQGAISGTGNSLSNIVTGNALGNTINGGAGTDTLIGGDGDDTYVVDNVGDVIVEDAGEGDDRVQSTVTYSLASNVEELALLGGANINGTGNELNNVIFGNTGANILNGGAGADQLAGGLGNDTYAVDQESDSVVELIGEGTDTIQSSLSWALGDNIENLTLTGSGDLSGTGNSLANTLTGNVGSNLLDGGQGADRLVGGLGNDTYIVDDVGDVVVEAASAGIDAVQAHIDWILSSNVENLVLLSGASNGTGNSLSNTIFGNASSNTLNGAAGADTLSGGAGDDIYIVDNVGDVITESVGDGTDTVRSSVTYTLASNLENLTLTGTGALTANGNDLDNTLIGNTGNNRLNGFSGSDTLQGNSGNDILAGGTGDDVFVFSSTFGRDTISDFSAGAGSDDTIRLSLGTSYDSFAEVIASAAQVGANTVITIDSLNTITLTGVLKVNLTVDDFQFV